MLGLLLVSSRRHDLCRLLCHGVHLDLRAYLQEAPLNRRLDLLYRWLLVIQLNLLEILGVCRRLHRGSARLRLLSLLLFLFYRCFLPQVILAL